MKSTARYRRNYLRHFTSVSFLLLAASTVVHGLSNVSIHVPFAVAAGATVNMTCTYDLENDTLYAVKWYRGVQFYGYIPKELPPFEAFGVLGSKVNANQSDAHNVVINDVQPEHSGKYRCEVSGDLPSFKTLSVISYLHVVSLPKGKPEISVEKLRYAVGDVVRANCTVPPGNPPANVTWSINGLPVNASFVRHLPSRFEENKQSTVAGLDYEITPDSFNNARLRIICHANIFHLYQEKAVTEIAEERPRLALVLGTRESSYISNSGKSSEDCLGFGILLVSLICGLR